jgi:hypothetical protein
MIDAEWTAWQSAWSAATGPLPDVRARAQTELRLHRRANLAFFALVAVALVCSVPAFTAPEPAVHAIGWVIVAFFGAMSIGYLWIQRGLALHAVDHPRGALAFLERRLSLERRAAHLFRWGYAGLCAVFVVVFPRVVEGHEAPRLEMAISFSFMFVLLVATFSAPWWVARRNRPREDEVGRWRRWMDEQHL